VKLPSFSCFLVDDLLRSSHMNATRHFIIASETKDDFNAKPLLVWLFLDDFNVSITPSSQLLSLLDIPSTFRASKVMFRQEDSERNEQDEWTLPMNAERMTYPSEWCLRLLEVLKASNDCYPSIQRTFLTPFAVSPPSSSNAEKQMQVWQTGFLPKM
jgi:HECT-like Ubiquitin-conjugating enzyme (E2)-binding